MITEECIELLYGIKTDAVYKILSNEKEAIDMAIKALEQQPSDDATLKDIFCMGCEYKEQEQKTGHWIKTPGMNEQCDVCGSFFPLSDFAGRPFEINHCPACGVKMIESQESEKV